MGFLQACHADRKLLCSQRREKLVERIYKQFEDDIAQATDEYPERARLAFQIDQETDEVRRQELMQRIAVYTVVGVASVACMWAGGLNQQI